MHGQLRRQFYKFNQRAVITLNSHLRHVKQNLLQLESGLQPSLLIL